MSSSSCNPTHFIQQHYIWHSDKHEPYHIPYRNTNSSHFHSRILNEWTTYRNWLYIDHHKHFDLLCAFVQHMLFKCNTLHTLTETYAWNVHTQEQTKLYSLFNPFTLTVNHSNSVTSLSTRVCMAGVRYVR